MCRILEFGVQYPWRYALSFDVLREGDGRLIDGLLGKLNRGISVVDTVEILRGSLLEGEEYRKAAVLGWAVELVCRAISEPDF